MAAESLEFEFPIKASVQLLVCYALAFLFEELGRCLFCNA